MRVAPSTSEATPGMIRRLVPAAIVAMLVPAALAAPNPAAVYCADLGYTLAEGACGFPDGSSCESWSFYRGECGARWSYCETHGGRVEARTESRGSWSGKYAACRFEDGSECGEQAYMLGGCTAGECARWGMSECAEAIEPEASAVLDLDETESPASTEPEESAEAYAKRLRRELGLGQTPKTRHTSFSCSYFKRPSPPVTRQLLVPGDLLVIDFCATEEMGCEWDDVAEVDDPFVLRQTRHADLDRNQALLRFKPKERFFLLTDTPGTSVVTFICRDDLGKPKHEIRAAVTVDPRIPTVSSGEDVVRLLLPSGEVKDYTPESTITGNMLKCKTIQNKGWPGPTSLTTNLYDDIMIVTCAADWLNCKWLDDAQISDTAVVVQYDHKYVKNPAFRKYPEERFRLLAIGEGSSEITYTCVAENGEEIGTHRTVLTVGRERWAEIVPLKRKKKAGEKEGDTDRAAVSAQPLCSPDTADPCRNCAHFDRLDYVYFKGSGGGLTLVPTEARVLRDWKYMDEACDPPIETDLSDHYPLLVTFSIEGPRAPAEKREITLLNYNVHAFEGIHGEIAQIVKNKVMVYEDYLRLVHIAGRILELDPDIVALEEVWGPFGQDAVRNTLLRRYPYSYTGPGASLLRSTSGVVVLSKFPLSNVEKKVFPIALPIVVGAIPTSLSMQDAFARKGVVTADVELAPGAHFRLGVSHALTDQAIGKGKWSKFYRENDITTFTLNGAPYIFGLKDWGFDEAVLARLYDYSWDYGGERRHDAGWKVTHVGKWSAAYEAIVSFELDGHPYLFALKGTNAVGVPFHRAYIRRINDDGAGWTDVWNGRWSSFYRGSAVTSFQFDGRPYIFALKEQENNKGQALIVRIRQNGQGYDDSVWGDWGLGSPQFVVSFQLDGRPYLFETNGGTARIARVDFDPATGKLAGWTFVYEGPLSGIPADCSGTDAPGRERGPIAVERIHSGYWGNDFFVSRAFELNGHPHLFSLKSMRGEARVDVFETLPGEGYLTRIADDGRGWQNLVNLPHMQIIIDETVRDDAPAIMMGDLNVHSDHYGNMNRMFETFGAKDAYVAVHGDDPTGSETTDACSNTLTQVFGQPASARTVTAAPCLDRKPPTVSPRETTEPTDLCRERYDRGQVTSVAVFELNGRPHIFVLTEKKRNDFDTKNVADIYRIGGGAGGR